MKPQPHRPLLLVLAFYTLLSGCAEQANGPSVQPLANPAGSGARLPKLATTANGVLLSWVESDPDGDTPGYQLRFAEFDGSQWGPQTTVAAGSNWFINWADFPSVYRTSRGRLIAHWLERTSDSTYSYAVKTSQSSDGITWSTAYTPHLDQTFTEHGFASIFEVDNAPAIVWLDGRKTQAANHDNSHGGDGAMTLRMRSLAASTLHQPSILLDGSVCDCCQTTAVNTAAGPVVLYRDRSMAEIRDIYFIHYRNDAWSSPASVYDDGWEISGCPVNGPQADALVNNIAVAWFTNAGGQPAVKLALTSDIADGFAPPLLISERTPLGRVDIAMLADHTVMVAWLESADTGRARIQVGVFDGSGLIGKVRTVATIRAARASGFLQLARIAPTAAVLAYTDVDNKRITSVRISSAGK